MRTDNSSAVDLNTGQEFIEACQKLGRRSSDNGLMSHDHLNGDRFTHKTPEQSLCGLELPCVVADCRYSYNLILSLLCTGTVGLKAAGMLTTCFRFDRVNISERRRNTSSEIQPRDLRTRTRLDEEMDLYVCGNVYRKNIGTSSISRVQ